MGAPGGNHNAAGNSGGKKGRSGRKSAYQETADANRLWRHWTDPAHINALLEKSRKHQELSCEEMVEIRAALKSDSLAGKMFDKLYPDNMNVDIVGQEDLRRIQESMQKIAEGIKKGSR